MRIALDFDGVLVDDESEHVMQSAGLETFRRYETANLVAPHSAGPLKEFPVKVHAIQKLEEVWKKGPGLSKPPACLARNGPGRSRPRACRPNIERVGVLVNDAFFLGGIEKGRVLEVLRPHIFFDDQRGHLEGTSKHSPAVHIPFGRLNERSAEAAPSLDRRIDE